MISETAVDKASTFDELLEQVDFSVSKSRSFVLGTKGGINLFFTLKHIERLLKSNKNAKKCKDIDAVRESTSTGVDCIFSSISSEMLGTLEHEIIESVNNIDNDNIADVPTSEPFTSFLGSDSIADVLNSETISMSNEINIDVITDVNQSNDQGTNNFETDRTQNQLPSEFTLNLDNEESEVFLCEQDAATMLTTLKSSQTSGPTNPLVISLIL